MEEFKDFRFKVHTNVNAMPESVRLMILIISLLLIYLVWKSMLWDPLQRKNRFLHSSIVKLEQQVKTLKGQLAGLIEFFKVDPTAELKVQLKQVEAKTISLRQDIKNFSKSLISPRQMTQTLQEVLDSKQKLLLIETKAIGASALLPEDRSGVQLYKHGLVLKFRGDYFNTMAYVRALEELQWGFVWDDLVYSVEEYPYALVTLNLHTLSYDKNWLKF